MDGYDKYAFKKFYGFYLIRLNGNSYVNTKFSISSIIPMYFKIDKFSFIHTWPILQFFKNL